MFLSLFGSAAAKKRAVAVNWTYVTDTARCNANNISQKWHFSNRENGVFHRFSVKKHSVLIEFFLLFPSAFPILKTQKASGSLLPPGKGRHSAMRR